ncbi:hypothetical protein CDIK_0975 [Cucumispora dikerogammari]|nr:hypothetical protein CDIK_0975 [Cucumispora dikerogammari]
MHSIINNWQKLKQAKFQLNPKKTTFTEKQKLLNKINTISTIKDIENILEVLQGIDLSKMSSELKETIFNIPNDNIENVLYQILLFKYSEVYGDKNLCKKYIKAIYAKEKETELHSFSINFIFNLFDENICGNLLIETFKSIPNNTFCWIRMVECYKPITVKSSLKKITPEEILFLYLWCLYQNKEGNNYNEFLNYLKEIHFSQLDTQTKNIFHYFLNQLMNQKVFENEFEETKSFLLKFFKKNLNNFYASKQLIELLNIETTGLFVINETKYLIDHHFILKKCDSLLLKKDVDKVLDILTFFVDELHNSYVFDKFLIFLEKFLVFLSVKVPSKVTILEFISNINEHRALFETLHQAGFYNIFRKQELVVSDTLERYLLRCLNKKNNKIDLKMLSQKLIERGRFDHIYKKSMKKYDIRSILIPFLYLKIQELIAGCSCTKAAEALKMFLFALNFNADKNSEIQNNKRLLLLNLLKNIIFNGTPLEKKVLILVSIMEHLNTSEIEPFLVLIMKKEQESEDLNTFLLLKQFCISRKIKYDNVV